MKFATLGPAGTNHDLNTRRYIEFHGIEDAKVVLLKTFFEGLDMMLRDEVDFMIQVCAHHHVAEVIERNHRDVFLVDSFIGKTKAMGVLTRVDVSEPRTVGFIPPTAGYFTPSDWPVQIHTQSNSDTALRLLSGELDSGFTALELATEYPGRFRVVKEIGEVDVVWLVYGKTRVHVGPITAWPDAPVRALFSSLRRDSFR